MAGQFRLVSEILADAAYRADIEGQDDRHPAANQLRLFNESAQQLRTRLSNMGFEWFLKRSTTATLSITAAVTGETYSEQDWPIDAQQIYGVHVRFQPDLWLPLRPISLGGIRDFQRSRPGGSLFSSIQSNDPRAFALREAPLGVTTVETAGKILILPLPVTARDFCIFYLQNWADVATTAEFSGHAGWIEWIIWDMVIKYSARDNDSAETHKIATIERQRVEDVMAQQAPRTQAGEAEEPRRADDVFDDYGPYQVP